jgi:hypothetical protein
MTQDQDQIAGPSPPEDETPFTRALAEGSVSPLADAAVGGLLSQMGTRISTDDVSLELAALRIVLYRLLTEHYDLPSLSTLLARVVTVALHAARTSHHVRQQDATELLDAITTILQELGGGR